MGEKTGISWATSTLNFWIGCAHADMPDGTKNPLCSNCYAERENGRWAWNGGGWGDGAPRKITSIQNWNQAFKWNEQAGKDPSKPWRVFSCSLADIWDKEAPLWPLDRQFPGPGKKRFASKLWEGEGLNARDVAIHEVVRRTPNLTWLLLTKRYEECARYLKSLWGDEPWPNVWIIFSAGTQETFDYAWSHLKNVKATVRGISAEPSLGAIDFRSAFESLTAEERKSLWWIQGGESGPKTRTMKAEWEASARAQCKEYGVNYFLKQLGVNLAAEMGIPGVGSDPKKWPVEMRVQQFPDERVTA